MAPERKDPGPQASRLDLLQTLGNLIGGPGSRPLLWERRGRWQVGFRWAVTPILIATVLIARRVGFQFQVAPILTIAAGIAVYNAFFSWIFHRYDDELRRDPGLDRKVTVCQAACDYLVAFLLIVFTGGAWSPLSLFLIFHVVIIAMQFFRQIAYVFAACAAGGMWLLLLAQTRGWIPIHAIGFRGHPLFDTGHPMSAVGMLIFFTATLFIVAAMVGQIMRLLRDRVGRLAETTRAIETLMNERTQFMLEVAHNLRAPLGASLGMVEVLRDGPLGPVTDRQLDYLRRIEQRLSTLDRTVRRLLTIARARDWSREIPDVVVDVADVARHARATYAEKAAARGIRFEVVIDPALPSIDSGADLVEQIVDNLVSNAIKYTNEGGEVVARFEREGEDRVRIEVRDTGIGIPADEQGRLFREFYRASNAKQHTGDGTGLGLVLVKQAVERHRGQLELTSDEGLGTTVVVRLPVCQANKAEG